MGRGPESFPVQELVQKMNTQETHFIYREKNVITAQVQPTWGGRAGAGSVVEAVLKHKILKETVKNRN